MKKKRLLAQTMAKDVGPVKFPWATRSSLRDSSSVSLTEARQLGQLTVLNVLLD